MKFRNVPRTVVTISMSTLVKFKDWGCGYGRKNKYIIGLGQLFTHFFNLTVLFVRSKALESTFLHVCCLYKYGSFFTFNQEPTGSLRNLHYQDLEHV